MEQAIHHHKHRNTNNAVNGQPIKTNKGLGGAIGQANNHHKHHSHLHQALNDLRAAEKTIQGGNTQQSFKDIEKAERQIRVAINHEHQFARR